MTLPDVGPATTPISLNIFSMASSILALLLRFISRKLSDAGIWLDDCSALASWEILAPPEPYNDCC